MVPEKRMMSLFSRLNASDISRVELTLPLFVSQGSQNALAVLKRTSGMTIESRFDLKCKIFTLLLSFPFTPYRLCALSAASVAWP